ncbi:MAG: YicC family protein [Verrucomicrobia bacterium]|nr:YicC family protein [Verrucomicrobiota bacterium]
MKSMTGYGRGECSRHGVKITVELNSVNRKQSDITINLPRELIELEPRIRDIINTRVARGRLNVAVGYHPAADRPRAQVQVNMAVAKAYLAATKKLHRELGIDGSITLDSILRAPGVVNVVEVETDTGSLGPLVETALNHALDRLVKMREREGKHLAADLNKRLSLLRDGVVKIRAEAPNVAKRYQQQLHTRIKNSGVELPLDDERLLKEVVIFADRADITEELTRLASHLDQFADCLTSGQPVGRTLDFLSQEMGREINTIGSKANDIAITQTVVMLKAELEKIREQVQNIE